MPKASMYENDFASGRKDDVGRTWQVTAVEAVAVSELMKEPANGHFRLAILRADPCHEGAALRRG